MRYRKKPVVIEAYQTDKELDIETLEGTMHASVGDYIITGVRGEQYPCKPDIFEQTYEPADVPTASPWHRVEDGDFPKNDESVFVYCETTGGIIKSTYHEFVKDGERIYWAFGGQLRKYWMPLPEPPKEDA
jgi:hypothetical protein